MAVTLKVLQNYPVISPNTVIAQCVFAGSYSTGGDTVDLTSDTFLDPGLLGIIGPNNGFLPVDVQVNGEGTDGSYCEWVPGTTLANGKLRLWAPGGTEVGATTYGAPWTNTDPVCAVVLHINLQPSDR